MNEPSKHMHWVTRKLLGSRTSHFKTIADYSTAELAEFQAEFRRRVERPTRPQYAAKAFAFLIGSSGVVGLFLFMFTPLFVPLGERFGFSVALAGFCLLAFVTAGVGVVIFLRTLPSCLCPSCALPVGMLASFCPVCGRRSLKEPAVNDFKQCQTAQCPDCGSSLHMTNEERQQSFRNCYCTHCGIPLATADGPDFAGPKMSKCNASLWNGVTLGLVLGLLLGSGLPTPYSLLLGLVGAVVGYAYMKHRSAKPKPPA